MARQGSTADWEHPVTDEDRFVYYQVRWCGAAPGDARRLAQERPDLVDAWNFVRLEHEYRTRQERRTGG